MVVGLIFVRRPDIAATSQMPETCKLEAEDLERVLKLFLVAHCISFFATTYREMYSAKTDLFGQLMRIIEVICIPILFTAILTAIELVTLDLVRMFSPEKIADESPRTLDKDADISDYSQGELYLMDKCSRKDWLKFQGCSFEWMMIELLVFSTFLFTMILLMLKSRFSKIGIDNSGQFEPVYMRILAQKIADSIPIQTTEIADQFFINSERIIQVENVAIKVCLNE